MELTPGGVELRPAETILIARARDFLAAGPAPAVPLVAHICQLPSPPPRVAEHMAAALLTPFREFELVEGSWRLAVRTPDDKPVGAARRLRELSYVVVDVETTGGRAFGGDRITEIAAVKVERGEIAGVYETLVNPERPIPPMVTAVTRITWAMVRKAPRFREICDEVTASLSGRVFVGHNAGFDWRFVSAEVARASGQQLAGRRLCTVRLARSVLPQLRRRSLDSVSRFFGVENRARHRAGGDALATAHVLIRLLDEAEDRGCSSWEDLEAMLATPARRRRGRGRRRSGMPGFADGEITA